jgi:hypothetical protein
MLGFLFIDELDSGEGCPVPVRALAFEKSYLNYLNHCLIGRICLASNSLVNWIAVKAVPFL